MKKEYKVGDKIWYASTGQKRVYETCPVCFGKLVIHITLGNDEVVQMECKFCAPGFEHPRGKIERYKYVVEVKEESVFEVRAQETPKGRKVEYLSPTRYFLEVENMFDTKEEAEERSKELVVKRDLEEAEDFNRKEKVDKSFAWHVGYHRKLAAQAEKDFAYHSKKAISMSSKSKTKSND